MAQSPASQTNASTTLAIRSSRFKGSQKTEVRKYEQEKINQVYEIIKKQKSLKNLDFNLMKIEEGKYISTFKYKDSDPQEIGKVYDDNGNLIVEGVITKETAFYFSLDEGITPIEDSKKKSNVDLDTYLVDVNEIDMQVKFIGDGVSVTEIRKKGMAEVIMTIENQEIKGNVKLDPDVIKVIENSNTNEIRTTVTSSGREDFLWYVLVVGKKNKRIKKYFQISSYEKKWSNYAFIASKNLYEKIEKIIHYASRLYREFKEDVDKMKNVSKLASIMEKQNNIFPEFVPLQKFREFVNLIYHFCPIEKSVKLIEVIKIIHYICKIYRESRSSTMFASEVSALNIEKLLSDQNAQRKYEEYNTKYRTETGNFLYNEAKKELKEDQGIKILESEIKNPIKKELQQ